MEDLLQSGYDVNKRHPLWNWPVVLSAVPFPKILKLLIAHGADINAQEENKWYSPLIQAVRNGYLESVRILLENGAETGLRSFAGLPALFYAFETKQQALIRILMAEEEDRNLVREVLEFCRSRSRGIATDLS